MTPTPRLALPPHSPGMRIGLFGGTFDPPHAAHLAASLLAMKRLKLDRMWWLVTPGNPLKDTRNLRPLAQRMAEARRLAHHPRIDVTGLEAVINTRYTYDTLGYLVRRCPGVRFVWVMGADNLRSFYRWQSWRRIANLLPMAVVDRMGSSLYATGGRAAQALGRYRLPERFAAELAERKPPAWLYLHGLKSPLSSTALRALRKTGAKPRIHAYLKSRRLGDSEAQAGNRKERTPLTQTAAPRARARRAPAPVSPQAASAPETLRLILARLDDMKAEDTVTIDLTGKTTIADAMVVTSGRSNRHVTSIADSAVEGLHKAGLKGIRVEGKKNGDWVLIDAGDVIVHVFRPEVRAFYDLEKMWAGSGARKQKPA